MKVYEFVKLLTEIRKRDFEFYREISEKDVREIDSAMQQIEDDKLTEAINRLKALPNRINTNP